MAKRLRTPTHVVLDIEGTVAPIQFVAETLFPYARKHVGAFLEASFEAPDVQVALAKLMEDAEVRGAGRGSLQRHHAGPVPPQSLPTQKRLCVSAMSMPQQYG